MQVQASWKVIAYSPRYTKFQDKAVLMLSLMVEIMCFVSHIMLYNQIMKSGMTEAPN